MGAHVWGSRRANILALLLSACNNRYIVSRINIDFSSVAVVVTVPWCVPSWFGWQLYGIWRFGIAGRGFDEGWQTLFWHSGARLSLAWSTLTDRERPTGKSCRICEWRSVKQMGGVRGGGGAQGFVVGGWVGGVREVGGMTALLSQFTNRCG